MAGLASKFAIVFMTRAGEPGAENRLDIVTRREKVIRETEWAVLCRTPGATNPAPVRTTIVMYGPSYGTCIVWDETVTAPPLQTVWRRYKQSKKPALPEEVLPPTWEELGPGPRHSTRKSTSPYKNPASFEGGSPPNRKKGELTSMVKSPGRTPMFASGRVRRREPSPGSEVDPVLATPKVPESTPDPDSIPHGQMCAWSAGRTLAEFPDALESAFRQVNGSFAQFSGNTFGAGGLDFETDEDEYDEVDPEYPEFSRFVENLAGERPNIGVWHAAARTEVDTFVTAYREKRFGSNMRAFKLQMAHEFGQDKMAVGRRAGKANMGRAKRKAPKASAMSSNAGSSTRKAGGAGPDPEGRATEARAHRLNQMLRCQSLLK
ncbi:hypothetical protein RSAG8_09593, partial [Rhizoctonia solani AG-8 WAC10335]